MKSILQKTIGLLVIISLIQSCKKETTNNSNLKDLLIGHWNLYEAGTTQTGFISLDSTPCHCMTFFYEDGISFSKDETFSPRYNYNGKWTTSGSSVGNFEFKDNKTITITVSPGTTDEHKLDLRLIKLDESNLWFSHSLFLEREYHLYRDN